MPKEFSGLRAVSADAIAFPSWFSVDAVAIEQGSRRRPKLLGSSRRMTWLAGTCVVAIPLSPLDDRVEATGTSLREGDFLSSPA